MLKNIPIIVLLGVKPTISSPSSLSSSKRKVSELAKLFNVKTLSCFALTNNDNSTTHDSISALKDGLREYLHKLANDHK